MWVSQELSTKCSYLFCDCPTAERGWNHSIVIVTYLTLTIQLSFTTSGINMAVPLTTCTKEEQSVGI